MKEIGIRAATGAVYVGLTLLAAWMGGLATFILFGPVCWLAAGELHNLLHPTNEGQVRSQLLAVGSYVVLGLPAATPFELSGSLLMACMLTLVIVSVCTILARNASSPGVALGNDLLLLLLIGAPPIAQSSIPWRGSAAAGCPPTRRLAGRRRLTALALKRQAPLRY